MAGLSNLLTRVRQTLPDSMLATRLASAIDAIEAQNLHLIEEQAARLHGAELERQAMGNLRLSVAIALSELIDIDSFIEHEERVVARLRLNTHVPGMDTMCAQHERELEALRQEKNDIDAIGGVEELRPLVPPRAE